MAEGLPFPQVGQPAVAVRRLRGFDHLKVIAAPAPEQNATSFRLPGKALPVTHRHLRYGFVEDH